MIEATVLVVVGCLGVLLWLMIAVPGWGWWFFVLVLVGAPFGYGMYLLLRDMTRPSRH
jgi:hypothetical protein